MGLLTAFESNTKTAKGVELGISGGILHLAPAKLSGHNVCPMASRGCAAACLNTAGRGQFDSTQLARIKKTQSFFADTPAFMAQLVKEIAAMERKAKRNGTVCAIRLNGTSDILFERIGVEGFDNIMLAFPGVQFYDYTKIPNRRDLPANYDVTFSLSENNDRDAVAALASGQNVAIVFDTRPDSFGGYPVIDGDKHDFRFLDERGVIVGLKAKGKAKHDGTGFVRAAASGGFDLSRVRVVAWQKVEAA